MTCEQATDMLLAAYQAEVEYRLRSFSDDEATRSHCSQLAAFLTDPGSKFGVMLCGICGNGKTTLLYAFRSALNWLSDCGVFADERKAIKVIDAREVAACAHDANALNTLRGAPMLALEDMGREATYVKDYGNVLNPMIDLLEYRYNKQLFTFITTNLTASEIRSKYGDRIADRFNEMIYVIAFEDTTYRR